MYNSVKLSGKNYDIFKNMLKDSKEFNELNKDYHFHYNSYNTFEKIHMKSSTLLLKDDTGYIGYMWYSQYERHDYVINDMWIDKSSNVVSINNYISNFKKDYNLLYECKKNNYNYELLECLGFIKVESNKNLTINLDSPFEFNISKDLNFEILKEGSQESLRCFIQNSIFQNKDRTPLIVEDIIFDENQDYYLKSCSVFLKYQNNYIGYGQLILDNDEITIVNFGLIPNFRGKGYSKILLKKLLNIALEKGYERVSIKVLEDNLKAISLYKSIGFTFKEEISTWGFNHTVI